MNFLNKKIISLLIIVIFIFTTNTVKAQMGTYINGVDPFVQFWVTTDGGYGGQTTLNVSDDEVLKVLNSLYLETLRNNFWYMDKLGIKAEKDQGLEKAKIQTLTNELDQEFIDWVNYGFNEGNPAYVIDTTNFFRKLNNRLTNDFVETLEKFFPDSAEDTPSFFKDIKRVLARGKDTQVTPEEEEETKKIILSWDMWKDKETYNNPQTIYNSFKIRLDKIIEDNNNYYMIELSENNGFLSFKKCDVSYMDSKNNISQADKNVITFYGDLNYYAKNLWEETKEGKKYENKVPIVSCVVITPGAVIYDKLSSINTAKDQILRMNAALTNGKDSLLGGIKDELESSQTNILKYGLLSVTATDTKKLNDKIKENSLILASSTGGNIKIEDDLSNPRNTESPYYPGKFLTDEEWKKIWGTGDKTITDAPGWYDKKNYLFGKDWDKWNVLNVFKKQN